MQRTKVINLMRKLLAIALSILLLSSCEKAETEDSAVSSADEVTEPVNAEAQSEIIYWQRSDTATNCSMISENIYSTENEFYIIDKAAEQLLQTSEVLDLSGEAVEANVLRDESGELRHIVFSGANREAVWIRDNKAFIVDYYSNQIFMFDAAANSVTPVLSDKAYGFSRDEYEPLAGKYDTVSWFLVPAVNGKGDRIVYWSNKYADNGVMSLNPGLWIADLQAGSEYRLNLGELVPAVGHVGWIDGETVMFEAEDGRYYKMNIASDEIEALDLPDGDTAICFSNGYAVYKTDNALYVNDLTKNAVTKYTLTEQVSFDRVFERNGIIAFGSLNDGSVWTVDTETESLDVRKVDFEENQFAFLKGRSESGLVIEIMDMSANETVEICGMRV